MEITKEKNNVQRWGNSTGLRLSKQVANLLEFEQGDPIIIIVEIDAETGKRKLIVEKDKERTKINNPFKNVEYGSLYHTMEDLYDGREIE
ncbi:MAG: hypothetical protein LBV67_08700 [Streptococcaceae bacterium]|jgi:antitoxin component of MazEF toxin-antitoxin module|nr:hypothetical protein [Streptococcaceae bacterium]